MMIAFILIKEKTLENPKRYLMKLFEKRKDKKTGRRRIYFCGVKICSYKKKMGRTCSITKAQYNARKQAYDTYISTIIKDIENLPLAEKQIPVIQDKVELKNIEVLPSLLDTLGKVIKKDGKIYRGIYPQSVERFNTLWKTGILQGLAKNKLFVEVKFTHFYTEDFPLIVECQKVEVISSDIWSFTHFKESLLLTLIIEQVINYFGYRLIDGHTANITFNNNKAIFFDLGSIIVKTDSKWCYEEIFQYHVIPLNSDRFGLNNIIKYHKFIPTFTNKIIREVLIQKKLDITSVDLLFNFNFTKTLWSDYCIWDKENATNSIKSNDRYHRICGIIAQYSPGAKTSLDLAGNSGYMSYLLSTVKTFDRMISADLDINAVEHGLNNNKKLETSIHLTCFDAVKFKDSTAINIIKSDVVLALALTHHLILTNKYDIDSMFYRIKRYVAKHIYIEFCPLGLWAHGQPLTTIPSWYTEELFEKYFKRHFTLLHKEVVGVIDVDGQEHNHRVLFVGENINDNSNIRYVSR